MFKYCLCKRLRNGKHPQRLVIINILKANLQSKRFADFFCKQPRIFCNWCKICKCLQNNNHITYAYLLSKEILEHLLYFAVGKFMFTGKHFINDDRILFLYFCNNRTYFLTVKDVSSMMMNYLCEVCSNNCWRINNRI